MDLFPDWGEIHIQRAAEKPLAFNPKASYNCRIDG